MLCVASVVCAQDVLQQRLQERLEALHDQTGIPGVSAAVALPDGRVVPVVVGLADVEADVPMRADTLLMQGSVGKTYVAAVAMQLVHNGKLSLDTPISKHLAEEPWFDRLPNAEHITVRMLMNHTSGLVRYEFQHRFHRDLMAQPRKQWQPHELLAYILDSDPSFAAGKGWEYSDTNYILLGIIIEKVAGRSYHQELCDRVLDPLELRQTIPVTGPRLDGLAQGYAGEGNPFGAKDLMLDGGVMIINPQFEWTGGGIASTSSDLARWGRLNYEGAAFDKSLLPKVLEGVPAKMLGRDAKYGLGVVLRPTPLGQTYGHSGYFPGYMAEVMYWPEHRIAVAVQINTSELQKVRPPLSQWCMALAEAALQAAGPRSKSAKP